MSRTRTDGLWAYFLLAVGITWAADLRIAWLTAHGLPPDGPAIAGAALSAFGPTLAAAAVAWRLGALRDTFGRWKTHPGWVIVALLAMPAVHAAANGLHLALGGHVAQWFYPPVTAEHVAALVLFSVGEEFGWRGFAYPRAVARWGALGAALVVGTVWTGWHFFMWFTADGPPTLAVLAWAAPELILGSLLFGGLFERGGRSMAVAIALHMGAHLDNPLRGPDDDLQLRALRLVALAVVAAIAVAPIGRSRRG